MFNVETMEVPGLGRALSGLGCTSCRGGFGGLGGLPTESCPDGTGPNIPQPSWWAQSPYASNKPGEGQCYNPNVRTNPATAPPFIVTKEGQIRDSADVGTVSRPDLLKSLAPKKTKEEARASGLSANVFIIGGAAAVGLVVLWLLFTD